MTPDEKAAILAAIETAADTRSADEKEIDRIMAGKAPTFDDDPKLYDWPDALSDEARREADYWLKLIGKK
ncbi:MAG: hypothetical protein JWO18_2030 [Microbacteriaceae bacterium]|nr:hypothetical protein [Microbacteriaceae bacterium]